MADKETAYAFLLRILLNTVNRAAQGAAYNSWGDDFARKEVREIWANDRKAEQRHVTVSELLEISDLDRRKIGFASWDGKLTLIPLWAFNYIADGESLKSISGDVKTKGKDEIDLDTRGGCIAWGFTA